MATSLIEREIPAVIGMQFEITDRSAIVFASEFYAALADGYPVDSAMAEARMAIYADGNNVEWATPVLHMSVPDGVLFEVPARAPAREQKPDPTVAVAAAKVEADAVKPVSMRKRLLQRAPQRRPGSRRSVPIGQSMLTRTSSSPSTDREPFTRAMVHAARVRPPLRAPLGR